MRRGLVAAAGAAAVLQAGCATGADDGRSGEARTIDERAGGYGGVTLGAPVETVRVRFGTPVEGDGFVPEGEEFRGPPEIVSPSGERPVALRYEEAAFLATPGGGVFAVMTTNGGDATRRGVRVGDPLARVRERYGGVECGEAVAGEGLLGGDLPTYPWCRTRVGNVDVFFGDDPVEAITLVRAQSP